MEWINYHHLLYFWSAPRRGSIVKASEALLLVPPTLRSQISPLEEQLGEKLVAHSGRRLALTDGGVGHFGRTNALHTPFYAISVQRKIKDPAVVATSEAAQEKILGSAGTYGPRGRTPYGGHALVYGKEQRRTVKVF